MDNDEFNGEINDKKIVLELLKISALPLLYMIEDIQKDIEIYRRAVKINSIAIAWDVFDVCEKEIILDAIKHPRVFRFLKSTWGNDEEIASRAIHLYPGNVFYTDYDSITLETEWLRKTKFYK